MKIMLERFVDEYSQRGYQFAYHLCGNAEEAKELVQEAFFRVMRKWDQYDSSQPLENWFLTILRNVYYDSLRRYERRHSVSLDAPVSSGEPDGMTLCDALADEREEDMMERLERKEAGDCVREVLDSLRPEYKAILTLCDMQGLGYQEIAGVLDCPLGTVRSRLNRARAVFKEKMLEQTSEVVES